MAVPVGGGWVSIPTDADVVESTSGTHGFRNSSQQTKDIGRIVNTIEASCRKFGTAEVLPLDNEGGCNDSNTIQNMSTENQKNEDVGIRITVEFT